MKLSVLTCFASAALLLSAFGQTPDATLEAPATPPAATTPAAPVAAPAATPIPSVAAGATATPADDLESRITRKAKKRGFSISVGDDDDDVTVTGIATVPRNRDDDGHRISVRRGSDFDDGALMAIPIVGIIFTTLFGAPVLVVGLIMFFSYWKARSLHRTVRLMVEKGQPVPDALFATPHSPAKQRSDMRRGVILMMVGFGVMILFGAMDDWDGGAWALGIIPFLIGAGYLLVWQLENAQRGTLNRSTDNPPPLP
jgi:hypothetical protein